MGHILCKPKLSVTGVGKVRYELRKGSFCRPAPLGRHGPPLVHARRRGRHAIRFPPNDGVTAAPKQWWKSKSLSADDYDRRVSRLGPDKHVMGLTILAHKTASIALHFSRFTASIIAARLFQAANAIQIAARL